MSCMASIQHLENIRDPKNCLGVGYEIMQGYFILMTNRSLPVSHRAESTINKDERSKRRSTTHIIFNITRSKL